MIFKTILIDDEPLALQRMERLLSPYRAFIQIIDTATGGSEAIRKINSFTPDLIFLDIQMPEINGFQVLEKINHQPLVIFTTAYDQYALRAFEENSVDYLLKPVDSRRLEKAINKLKRVTSDEIRKDWHFNIDKLVDSLKMQRIKRVRVKLGGTLKFINLEEIYYFKSSEKYVELHTFDSRYLIDQPLKQLEKDLPQEDFIRIHRSLIINLNHVKEVVRSFKGSYVVVMNNKEHSKLPISRHSKYKLGL